MPSRTRMNRVVVSSKDVQVCATDTAWKTWCDESLQRGRKGDHVPGYLLLLAYGLLALGVVGCLAFIANSFEDEESNPERLDRER